VTGLLLGGGMLVVAFIMHEARAEYPLIHLSVLARPNIAVAALLIVIYPGFGTTGGFLCAARLSDPRPGIARLADR
jgi:hypothetical protein